jgi:hypothetical protein
MVVGVCILELNLPGLGSLKEKRSVLKSLLARLHKEFNVTAAEVDLHDAWQAATLGIATVSTSAVHAHSLLNNLAHWIEVNRPDLEVVDEYIEVIPFSSASGS